MLRFNADGAVYWQEFDIMKIFESDPQGVPKSTHNVETISVVYEEFFYRKRKIHAPSLRAQWVFCCVICGFFYGIQKLLFNASVFVLAAHIWLLIFYLSR